MNDGPGDGGERTRGTRHAGIGDGREGVVGPGGLPGRGATELLRDRSPSPLTEVDDERFTRHGVRLLLKREDLLHPEVVGNKWRKLVPTLREMVATGDRTLLTFGGAHSNHLRATAAAGRLLGLSTIGVVRGEELADRPPNPSLAACLADGMRPHFVSRSDYRRRADPAFIAGLRERFGPFRSVPEGGTNTAAVRGCVAPGRELAAADPRPDVVAVACGTGGTLAGLAAGLAPGMRALGVPVLRGGFHAEAVRALQQEAFGGPRGRWTVDDRFHHGGFARVPAELEEFALDFADRHGLPTVERVYVAKVLWALRELAAERAFRRGTVLAAVITG
ncbi:1-aminocyclopropane-1-carboxylate deaminase/D-cysteine desulfhydrase [Streptomyces sp. ST2-7A]|uniref:1-aminocyclopropane-1-carboxylate deaminase/D-cysteine desulfhydrase n=1 Tax=Streptomyces sp. ST2-7A TaxID=2907214 RepID=UPI001F1F48B8|nr:pyridoxal-phosphate dependent enzyme [Streptomyces sp. ST2-7A]MCE7082785.1 pyridoxal-phosphate dependent enzyme [Streptomyces sp. ST2-7A]